MKPRAFCATPGLQKLYKLDDDEIAAHIDLLRARADLVSPIMEQPVVLADPNDDPVVHTAIAGRADILCAVDRDFYAADVVSFCRERGIEIMDEAEATFSGNNYFQKSFLA
jgi:hypothetical protein